jgi:hypothetical protein
MRRHIGFLCAAIFLITGTCRADALVIDHRNTDITELTQGQIERAKSALHIAYGHTSHGSQLTEGMSGLVGFANGGGKGLALPTNIFAWNNGGSGGALDLHDYAMGGDVGYYPQWVANTTNYLNNPANADVNVILWSWCGQMDDKYAAGTLSNEYLLPMAELEQRYPNVTFVYMTGHVDIWDDADNKAACQVIRDWCSVSNRILYDFNDVEHHDPDGTYFEFVNDDCAVYAGAGGAATGNWATEWQAAHTEGVDWYTCGSAHSEPLNANQKAYAAWALWCALGADRDRDGLGDAWEERHGSLAQFGGGTNDFDADGIVDLDEFILDSSPTNATARFEIGAPALATTATVTFASSTGRVYELKVCHDLEVGAWDAVTNRPGTGGVLELTDESPWAGLNAYGVGVSVPE